MVADSNRAIPLGHAAGVPATEALAERMLAMPMIEFKTLKAPNAFRKMWGAQVGAFTFVIMRDQDEREYNVTIKPVGAVKFDGSRHDLGEFDSFGEAAQACEDFLRQFPEAAKT